MGSHSIRSGAWSMPSHQLSLLASTHKTCVTHHHASTWLHWEDCLLESLLESPIDKNASSLPWVVETAQRYILVKLRLLLKFLLSRRKRDNI